MATRIEHNRFSHHFVDLAAARLGGQTLYCTDDFFAEMDNLIKPGPAIFIDDKYTDRGKWMDGWESRRRRFREDGTCADGYDHDWCVLRLGAAGKIIGINADTHHFLGNAPQAVSLEACAISGEPNDATVWQEILPKTAVQPGMENLLDIPPGSSGTHPPDTGWTHIRFHIYPDGGVARLRVYGEVIPAQHPLRPDTPMDLASLINGAKPLACSDMFFSDMHNLVMPGRSDSMADGWETKRRRPTGNPDLDRPTDWLLLKLAGRGRLHQVLIDTAHFKGNYPESFHLEGADLSEADIAQLDRLTPGDPLPELPWQTILPRTRLHADQEHPFASEIQHPEAVYSHVRLHIYPDGGVSRLRLFGCLHTAGGTPDI